MHSLGLCHALQGNILKAISYSRDAIRIHEGLREYLSDKYKLLLDDLPIFKALYKVLITILINLNNFTTALFIAEQGGARALADLMAGQYGSQNTSNLTNEPSLKDMINFFLQQRNNCLFFLSLGPKLCIWFVGQKRHKLDSGEFFTARFLLRQQWRIVLTAQGNFKIDLL